MPDRGSLAITDPVLSNFALAYSQKKMVTASGSSYGMTADFIFPRVPHKGEGLTGKYYTYNKANNFQIPDARRAPKTDFKRVTWDVSSASYVIEEYGFGGDWDDTEVDASLSPVDLNRDTTEVVTNTTLLAYERRVNAIVCDQGSYTNTGTPGTAWDSAGSDPIADIITAKRTIYASTGVMPNKAVIGWKVWFNGLANNDEVVSRVQAANLMGGQKDVTPQMVGQLMDLDLRVNTTLYDSAVEGQTSTLAADFRDLTGSNEELCLVFYSPEQAMNVKTLTLGLTIEKEYMMARRWRENPKTNVVTVSQMCVEKLVAELAGYLLYSVVS